MKTLFYSLLLASSLSLKAQIIDIYNDNTNTSGYVAGAYYKDLTNVHDQYIGTWLYTNGNTSLKLVFQEREHVKSLTYKDGMFFYKDWLIGEGQYIENGILKWNSLPNLSASQSTDYVTVRNHVSFYNISYTRERVFCPECAPGERRLKMHWLALDSNFNNLNSMGYTVLLRRFFENGVEKLKVSFYAAPEDGIGSIDVDNPPVFTPPVIPLGSYVLTKIIN
jgi:hypothetical protein